MNLGLFFPIISVNGDNPFDLGYQYGIKCKDLINKSIKIYKTAFKKDLKLNWDEAINYSRKYLPIIENYSLDIINEIKGVAKGADKKFEEILALHLKTEMKLNNSNKRIEGCTTIASTPEVTKNKNVLVGKNWDWTPVSREIGIVLKKTTEKGLTIVTVTEAGLLGRDGFNSSGVCVVANALMSNKWRVGIPLHVMINKILYTENLNDAMKAIFSVARASSTNFLLASISGEALCIEAAPEDYNVLWDDNGILAHSNHFIGFNPNIRDCLIDIYPHTLTRYHRAKKLLNKARNNKSVCIDTFKEILTDHFDYPFSICLHPDCREEKNLQIQTNASFIIDLNCKKIYVASGNPCENQYFEINC